MYNDRGDVHERMGHRGIAQGASGELLRGRGLGYYIPLSACNFSPVGTSAV